MIKIKDKLNRAIHVIDDALTVSEHNHLYEYVVTSNYVIGFQDTDAVERLSNRYLHSKWTPEMLKQSGFIDALKHTEVWDILKDLEVTRITVNLSVPSDSYYPHCHTNELALVYYLNLDWKPEWAGETLFFEENLQDIVYASSYKPRRLILMDGGIPHTIRPQSVSAPHYRFSLAMFFRNKREIE